MTDNQDDFINIEMLITEVERRPPLYDITLKEYSDRNIKQRLWAEVCQSLFQRWNEMNETQQKEKGKEVQNKWRNIKDRFKKELALQKNLESGQAAKKKRKYYFDNLLFLLPSMDHQSTISNINAQNSPQTSESSKEVHIASTSSGSSASRISIPIPPSNLVNPNLHTIQKKKSSQTFEQQLINTLKEKSSVETDIDENKSFALMLVPMMGQLNDEQKFFAKTEILRVMRQAKNLECVPPVCTYMHMQSYLPPQNILRGSNTYMSTTIPSPTLSTTSSSRQSLPHTTQTSPSIQSPSPTLSTTSSSRQSLPHTTQTSPSIPTETTNYAHNYYEQVCQSIDHDSDLFEGTNYSKIYKDHL